MRKIGLLILIPTLVLAGYLSLWRVARSGGEARMATQPI